ncbi:MAG: DUF3110 domain-containing protein [Symploca sp. SIO3E6]|nr:DUF3110 domain-containing protein [Caldora sp. SIO3E6]
MSNQIQSQFSLKQPIVGISLITVIAVVNSFFRSSTVYVLLHNAGTDNEEIHTIVFSNPNDEHDNNPNQKLEYDKTPHTVLMFESKNDAVRFNSMLFDQDFPTLTVEAIDAQEILIFCQSFSNYHCKQIPEGADIVPPKNYY